MTNLSRGAAISPCGNYRYSLERGWAQGGKKVLFIGLNPSTADATTDDPTIRRCVGFAKAWGYSGMLMGNLFAYRATDPSVLRRVADPIGPENDGCLKELHSRAAMTVAAWGNLGSWTGRDKALLRMLGPTMSLGTTKSGYPRHPLYVPGDALAIAYQGLGNTQ